MRRIAVLALLLACAHARRGADERWVEARTDHFILRTDLPEGAARETASQLELVRAALLSAPWHAAKPPRSIVQVVILADSAELEEYAPRGFVSDDALGLRRVVIAADSPVAQNTVLTHELAHALVGTSLLRRPRWVAEGLACYLETLRAGKDGVVIGDADPARVRFLLEHPGTDSAAVMRVGDEALAMSGEERFAYETRAWAIFHLLADARRPQLDDFLHRLAKAEDPDAAFKAAFKGYSGEQLGKDIDAWLAAGRFGRDDAAAVSWHGDVAVRALDAADVQAQRADLFLSWHRERAQDALEAALKADPGQPLALAAAAKLGMKADAHEAVKRHPDDDRAWLALLQSLPEGSPERAQTAAKLLERSPLSVPALRESAWAALAQRHAADALPLAQKAVSLSPGDVAALDVLAVSLASNKRCPEADRVARRALEAVPDGAVEAVRLLRARGDDLKRICEGPRAATKEELAAPPEGYVVHVPPHAKQCGSAGPVVPVGAAKPGDAISVRYLVKKSGKLAAVQKRSGSDVLFGIVKSWLSSCKWDPATEAGVPVEDWAEQVFTFR